MRFRLMVVTILCLVLITPLIAADVPNDVPLPKNLQLEGKTSAALIARAWSGRWSNPASPPAEGLNAILIFQKVMQLHSQE
jgi:hypothetical protein